MTTQLIRLGLACVLATSLLAQESLQSPPSGVVATALDLYAAGSVDTALATRPFDLHTAASAIGELDRWVGPTVEASAPAAAMAQWQRRAQVAARFAVDVTAQREITREVFAMPLGDPTREGPGSVLFHFQVPDIPPFDHERFSAPIVAWACAHMPADGPVAPWEEPWWMASIGLLQDAGEWRMLAGDPRESRQGDPTRAWERAVYAQVKVGHLAEAVARLGDRPRLRLATVVTRSASLIDLSQRFTVGGGSPVGGLFARPDVLRVLEDFARTVNSGRFAEFERALEALLNEPTLEAEVALRLAQLRVMRRDWPATTRWLDRAEAATTDDINRATVDYFRGWVFERAGREDDALRLYESAYTRFPQSPNLNTLLAAQLMRVGRRSEAAKVIEAFMLQPFDFGRRDLWRILVAGEGRYVRGYARRMREAQ